GGVLEHRHTSTALAPCCGTDLRTPWTPGRRRHQLSPRRYPSPKKLERGVGKAYRAEYWPPRPDEGRREGDRVPTGGGHRAPVGARHPGDRGRAGDALPARGG